MATLTSRPPGLRGYNTRWSDATGTALVGPDGGRRDLSLYSRLLLPGAAYLNTIFLGDSLVAASIDAAFQFARMTNGLLVHEHVAGGVGGNTTAQMLARVSTTITNITDVCIIQGGTNDITQGVSVGTIRGNISAIIDALLALGVIPIVCAIPPKDSAVVTSIDKANLAVRLMCMDRGVWYIDPWRTLVAPATGAYDTGMGVDGTHPTQAGDQLAAAAMLADFNARRSSILLPRWNSPDSGILANGYFLTDTNADGVPDGWSTSNTPTGTLTAGTGAVRGNWFKIAKSGASAQTFAWTAIAASGNFVAGDEALVVGRYKIEGVVGARVSLYTQQQASGTRHYAFQYEIGNVPDTYFSILVPFVTGSTDFRIYMMMELQSPAATFDASISVAEVQIFNLTKTRALV